MKERAKDPLLSRMDGDDSKQLNPDATGTFCFHYRKYQHLDFFERMMLSGLLITGLCLFQIPFSFMVSITPSSKKPSMILSRKNYLFIPLQSHSTLFVHPGVCGIKTCKSVSSHLLCCFMARSVFCSSFAPLASGTRQARSGSLANHK